ncbi:uncharacterized protein SRS1_11764 [Sporisorium reilianum f. sp. reilianum]|uniref:Histone-lysine N-methyltransferase n=1 Tax=Sporisorium reilianum f. sp. reilianum TaxID=72559 RepID=A0A2N8U6U3_9BASI|nr:uncharacterized protein SRS1_11764 [Sporisorium reilianum f. sp. reilianum]
MPPARRTARASMSSSATSAPTTLASAAAATRPPFPSTLNAGSRSGRRSLHTANHSLTRTAFTSPSRTPADNSYDDPIVVSDTDTDMDSVHEVFAGRIDAADTSKHADGLTGPHSLTSGSGSHLRDLPLPSPTFAAAAAANNNNNHDESRSSTTLDRSYATSLNSDLNAISDGSLSSLSSIDSDSDTADIADDKSNAASASSPRRTPRLTRTKTLASTPLRDIEATPEATARSSSSTPTPSRRSARIVSSGSSVQKALQRRDELDAKMLASPIRRKPDSPEAPPAKRPRGRPRKSAPDAGLLPSSSATLPTLQTTTVSSIQNTPASASARRSARLSMPSSHVANSPASASTQSLASQPIGAKQAQSQELGRDSRRGGRSEGVEAVVKTQDQPKPSPVALISSSVSSSSVASTSTIPQAHNGAFVAGSGVVQAAPTPPVKRGPGRPRKSQVVVPTAAPPTPVTPVAEEKHSALAGRLRKRSLASVSTSAQASPAPVVQEPQPETPRRKRGRPARATIAAMSETVTAPVPAPQAQAMQRSISFQKDTIDLLDDDISELSDVSDSSLESSQPSRSASQSAQPGPRRRGRPPSASTSDAKKLKRASKQDKDGKAYHVTGLYAGEADAVASTSARRPAETPNAVLPSPIHFGAKLLTEERDFCLPYPIHQSMDQLRDRVNAKRKPPRYQQISKNKYVSRAKLQGETPLCNCKPGSGCGADCINRMLMFICDPRTCPSASNCTNVSLGRRPTVKTTVAYYGRRGFGLKTLEAIKKDDFIDEYRGEVINLSEAAKRVTEEYKATGNFYLLDYDSAAGELLDGGRKGNITRFANHSCDPNCRIEKFIICGTDEALSAEFQIGLFANRDIAEGEELTYNYGWAAFQPRDITGAPTAQVPSEQCLCGASNCSGILGGKKAPVPKAVADVVTANSRKKTAKGRGKGKGKARKSAQSSRVRMRSMTPMLTASRLSAAAMPSSALLTVKAAARSSRKREEAQSSLNLLNQIVIRRREHTARAAEDVALSTSAVSKDISMEPAVKGGQDKALDSSEKSGQSASSSRSSAVDKAKEAAAPLQAAATSAPSRLRVAGQVTSSTGPAECLPLAAPAPTEASASASASADAPANAAETALSGKAASTATSRVFPRLPLLKRLANSRMGSAFGRKATGGARGTKDRRWSAAEALISDNDEASSVERDVSDSEGATSDFQKQDDHPQRRPASKKSAVKTPGRRGRRKLQLSTEEAARRAAERRTRNAFLARVRRASKRGIVIEDPTQHPLKKISIQCTAAPENTYIPDLPSSLVTLGMTTADARRSRNAFLARVRRAMKRGYAKDVAIKMAAKPLPGDPDRDTPVMKAQRAYMEQIEREAAEELTGSVQGNPRTGAATSASMAQGSRSSATTTTAAAAAASAASAAADKDWVDGSSWTARQ